MKVTDEQVVREATRDGEPSCPHLPYCELRLQPQARLVSQLVKQTFGFVLAGGRGSRLRQLTDWRAKPAVHFGGKFRIVDFTLSNCVNSGVRRIGVATQYKAQSLIRHLQRGWSFLDGRIRESVDVLPAQQQVEETWYAGTADAVFQNLNLLRTDGCKYVLVLSGDHVYKMDYGNLIAYHVARQADVTVTCIEVPLAEAHHYGIMEVDDALRVTGFVEKPAQAAPMPGRADHALANMGVYVFDAEFLFGQVARDARTTGSSHDFGRDVIPWLVPRHRVIAHRFAESCVGAPGDGPYWRDVGTLDAFWEANMELTRVTPKLNLYDESWPIWTAQEQLPPAKFVFDEEHRRGYAIDSVVSGGCIVSGATVRRSLLFSNVRVENNAQLEDAVVLPEVHVGRGAQIRRAIIDAHCRIPEGFVVGVDPAADRERGFEITERGIVLVTPEMLGQSVQAVR